MNQGKVTDNVELDFPARMSDGRQFTDYSQNCLMNNRITGSKGSWLDRYYLINNGEAIHSKIMTGVVSSTKCTKCTDNTVLPVQTVINCSPVGCNYKLNDPSGIGQGRDFN
jgi:hypothetical protein